MNIRYNTNNNWVDGIQPKDYREAITKCNTSQWIDKFHESYVVITLDIKEVKWLKEAFRMGCQTLRFPHQYDDEMEDLLLKYNDSKVFNGTSYFVRTEGVSLKRGKHGAGPYKELRPIIESLVTCIPGHSGINDETTEVKLYLLPWIDIPYYKQLSICP